MNIIIPIAGANHPGGDTEYIKSLQEIERKTVLQYSFESLQSLEAKHFIVVVKREDVSRYHLDNIVKLLRPEAEIVIAEGETMGAACTCMLAIDRVDMRQPLLIVGSDQLLTIPAKPILDEFQKKGYDGGVVIFDDVHPRWSYVRLDGQEHVVEAAEKRPISRNAVAGFYYYRTAQSFFEGAERMIMKRASVNDRYYICPVFNEMILQQQVIGVHRIEKAQYFSLSHDSGMEAFRAYLQHSQGGKRR